MPANKAADVPAASAGDHENQLRRKPLSCASCAESCAAQFVACNLRRAHADQYAKLAH